MPKRKLSNDEENLPNFQDSSNSTKDVDNESEDLFGEDYMEDYKSISELDTYDATDTLEEPMSYEEMQRIEDEINRKENETNEQKKDDNYNIDLKDLNQDAEEELEFKGDFLDQDFYKRKVVSFFIKFLNSFGSKKYVKMIRKMCSENEESLYISYLDLEKENSTIASLLVRHAEEIIRLFDKGLEIVVKTYFPNYGLIKSLIHTRIVGLPVLESLRSLRNNHLNTLVKVSGIVTRRTTANPAISVVKFTCMKCNAVFGPFTVDTDSFRPSNCFECQSKGPFTINSNETVYKDYQKLTLQEIPGTVPSGSLPRNKEVICYFDLVDKAKPGDEVEVIGVYKNNYSVSLNVKNGFPIFFTAIDAVSITNKETEFSTLRINDDDIEEIKKLSKNPNIINMITRSIAPSIFGFEEIKKAIALSLFGGVRKTIDGHNIRGDINVLMLGDPGTAKSQFLRYIQGIMHKSVLATGQGTSSVGLTASVHRDHVTKEWTLEGGALVLADKGICLIDEFDKMNDVDRTSIHEAMEQQTVSISKAGIVTSLNARCGVIAAANPIRGRYNHTLTFNQNVNLSDPIITRFDILCVVKDVVESKNDERMANFILESHYKSLSGKLGISQSDENTPENDLSTPEPVISQDLLRKYIVYTRLNIHPVINDIDLEKITSLYSELRRESVSSSGIPITVRHIESVIRMSEAFAKIRLSNVVLSRDIDEAIHVTLKSFIGTQKYSIMKSLRKKFARFLFRNENCEIMMYILGELFNEKIKWCNPEKLYILKKEFEAALKSLSLSVTPKFYGESRFLDQGYRLSGEKIIRI